MTGSTAVARLRARTVATARARLPAPLRRPLGRLARRILQGRSSGGDYEQMRSAHAAALATTELGVHELTAQLSALERTVSDLSARLDRAETAADGRRA